jgi:tetratricopeptide (TPR) repeat protein
LIIYHYPQVDRKNYFYAYDIGQNIFKSLPENSVIFAGYDVPLFELQYLQVVEGQRKDVKIIPGADPALIKIPDWMIKRVKKDFPDYSLPIEELSQKYSVYANMNTELFWGDKARDFIPEGLVYHYPTQKNWQENFDAKIAQENFQKYTYRGTYTMTNQTNTFTREILFHYANAWTNLGMVFQKKKQPEKAAQFYQKALEISPENLIAWVNFAGTFLDRGMYNEARQEYKKILKVFPDSDIARNGLTVAEQKLNQ